MSLRIGDDPTEAILSKSALDEKKLCDYVINVATGCRHGCKFCYVPSTPSIRTRSEMLQQEAGVENPQKEWGEYLLRRPEETAEKLDGVLKRKRTWKETEGGKGIVALSFATDCYQDAHTAGVTRGCIESLASNTRPSGDDIYTRILTRNPILALQDIDAYTRAQNKITIGSSIPSLNAGWVNAIEPRTPHPEQRLKGLKEFSDAGVNTFVSMSPTYPSQSREDIKAVLNRVSECEPDVVFHEPINPRGGNFEMTIEAARENGQSELASDLEAIQQTDNWVSYAVEQFRWVQEIAEELGIPVHLWPDEALIKETEGDVSQWLQEWKQRQSPEEFAGRNVPDSDPPPLPSRMDEQSKLSGF